MSVLKFTCRIIAESEVPPPELPVLVETGAETKFAGLLTVLEPV